MPRIPGTTDAQSAFLRAFRQPRGPAPEQWPSIAVFRRWLRRPSFVAALRSLQGALQSQAEFRLLIASVYAADLLQDTIDGGESNRAFPERVKAIVHLLRLGHQRGRFPLPNALPAPTPSNAGVLEILRSFHRDLPLGEALEHLNNRLENRKRGRPDIPSPFAFAELDPNTGEYRRNEAAMEEALRRCGATVRSENQRTSTSTDAPPSGTLIGAGPTDDPGD